MRIVHINTQWAVPCISHKGHPPLTVVNGDDLKVLDYTARIGGNPAVVVERKAMGRVYRSTLLLCDVHQHGVPGVEVRA
jgi:hypothetical protein